MTEPLDVLDWVIDDIDLVLIMSVNPGFGGQSFIDSALRKIENVRRRIDACGKDIRLEVDGGIKTDNIAQVAAANNHLCLQLNLNKEKQHLHRMGIEKAV